MGVAIEVFRLWELQLRLHLNFDLYFFVANLGIFEKSPKINDYMESY